MPKTTQAIYDRGKAATRCHITGKKKINSIVVMIKIRPLTDSASIQAQIPKNKPRPTHKTP